MPTPLMTIKLYIPHPGRIDQARALDRTEGWIVGLQMVALSLRERDPVYAATGKRIRHLPIWPEDLREA